MLCLVLGGRIVGNPQLITLRFLYTRHPCVNRQRDSRFVAKMLLIVTTENNGLI